MTDQSIYHYTPLQPQREQLAKADENLPLLLPLPLPESMLKDGGLRQGFDGSAHNFNTSHPLVA